MASNRRGECRCTPESMPAEAKTRATARANVQTRGAKSAAILRAWPRHVTEGWMSIWDLAKPVIAQVHGYCLAGGSELASGCDLIYVAEDAQIGLGQSEECNGGGFQQSEVVRLRDEIETIALQREQQNLIVRLDQPDNMFFERARKIGCILICGCLGTLEFFG